MLLINLFLLTIRLVQENLVNLRPLNKTLILPNSITHRKRAPILMVTRTSPGLSKCGVGECQLCIPWYCYTLPPCVPQELQIQWERRDHMCPLELKVLRVYPCWLQKHPSFWLFASSLFTGGLADLTRQQCNFKAKDNILAPWLLWHMPFWSRCLRAVNTVGTNLLLKSPSFHLVFPHWCFHPP